ncbi:MAG: hypothetical protein H0W86_05305 [Armatimonadetes bacterium]|nr:hypothetical protein [Armatimonadota bacterium]
MTLLRIVWNDLNSSWEPERVWASLSILADEIIELAGRVVWSEMGGEGNPPVAVIALGKHGSNELNYSSDIDLMFIAADSEADLAQPSKFCERLTRALEGRMGRGALYRVDLRLRPLGRAGPVLLRKAATLNYYQSYCEPWEILAMIRARSAAGDTHVGSQFIADVSEYIYRGARSEIFLESIVDAKKRYEDEVRKRGETDSNMKLGPGGIRDIEFIVQALQLVVGHEAPELQGASTASALEFLAAGGHLGARHAELLMASYRLFRQIEHRIQLRYDLQSHNLPADANEREVLARLVGSSNWQYLHGEIRRRRAQVRELLESRIPLLRADRSSPVGVAEALGWPPETAQVKAAEYLIGFSDAPDSLLNQIREDRSTAERVKLIASFAQRVIPEISFHRELWDVAFSEEIEFMPGDETDPASLIRERIRDAGDSWEAALSAFLRREFMAACIKDALHRDVERTFGYLTKVAEASLLGALDCLGGEDIDIVALGRLGSSELLLPSDWDVTLLVKEPARQAVAERIGQDWLRTARRISMASGYFPLDVRLRPEGSAGLVVRSIPGFNNYAESSMETWERFAFTWARSLRGWPETAAATVDAVSASEWGWEQESEMLQMRSRIHNERARSWELRRDIKLGEGFLLDLEWLCSILRLRHPEAQIRLSTTASMLRQLGRLSLLSQCEADELADAALLFARLRNIMYLLEFDSDSVLPENPEKLDRMAASLKLDGANDVLDAVYDKRDKVMSVYGDLVLRTP